MYKLFVTVAICHTPRKMALYLWASYLPKSWYIKFLLRLFSMWCHWEEGKWTQWLQSRDRSLLLHVIRAFELLRTFDEFPDGTIALDLNASPLFCFLFLESISIITTVGFNDQDFISISDIESYSLLESV